MRRVCLPGSLNAMWPSSPIPPRKSSMPPYFLILASYSLHSSIKFFAFPFRMLTCEGGMSTGFVVGVRSKQMRVEGSETHRARRIHGT